MRNKDITQFVTNKLNELTNENGLSHSVLITNLLEAYPNLKDRVGAANRINSILKNKEVINSFRKIKGQDKKVYLIRNQQVLLEEKDDERTKPAAAGTETNEAQAVA